MLAVSRLCRHEPATSYLMNITYTFM